MHFGDVCCIKRDDSWLNCFKMQATKFAGKKGTVKNDVTVAMLARVVRIWSSCTENDLFVLRFNIYFCLAFN